MNARLAFIALATLSLGACATGPYYADRHDPYYDDAYPHSYTEQRVYREDRIACERCGTVDRIESFGGRTTGAGAVTGAIVGGALGNQVGKGDGRKAATVAGAVLGGVAGNEVERNVRNGYEIYVTMDDGRRVVVSQDDLDGIYEGGRVFVSNGHARPL